MPPKKQGKKGAGTTKAAPAARADFRATAASDRPKRAGAGRRFAKAAEDPPAADAAPQQRPKRATGRKRPRPDEDEIDDADVDDADAEPAPVRKRARNDKPRNKRAPAAKALPAVPDQAVPEPVAAEPPTAQADNAPESEADPDPAALSEADVLAQVETDVDCTFKGNDATLNNSLQVHKDPAKFDCRLGYRTTIRLTQEAPYAGKGKGRADDTVAAITNQRIGYIESWRIDKPTAAHPNATKTEWLEDLLRVRVTGTKQADPLIRENAMCMQALYTKAGTLRKEVAGRHKELLDNSLIFIQMIYISTDFQRQGLLRPVLRGFHDLLARLPEWYAFSGSLVLVPAIPAGKLGADWGDDPSELEVEGILSTAYGKHGGYEVWVKDADVSKQAVTVMGRTVPDAAAAEGAAAGGAPPGHDGKVAAGQVGKAGAGPA